MRVPAALRRPDWLKYLYDVLFVGLLALGVVGVFNAATAVLSEHIPVELPVSEVIATIDARLRGGAGVNGTQFLEVVVVDPSPGQRAVWALTWLPTYAVVLVLLVLLLRIVGYARGNDPFSPVTVRRLRVLATVALAGGNLAVLVQLGAELLLSRSVLANGVAGEMLGLPLPAWRIELPLTWFLVGVGLFAVAEVVNRGCAMRAELETVV